MNIELQVEQKQKELEEQRSARKFRDAHDEVFKLNKRSDDGAFVILDEDAGEFRSAAEPRIEGASQLEHLEPTYEAPTSRHD